MMLVNGVRTEDLINFIISVLDRLINDPDKYKNRSNGFTTKSEGF